MIIKNNNLEKEVLIILGENNYKDINNNVQIINIITKKNLVNTIFKFNNNTFNLGNIDAFSNYRIKIENLLDINNNYELTCDNLIGIYKRNFTLYPNGKIITVNCDCDWHLSTKIWENLKEENNINMIYHIGDQIYNDLIFHRVYNTLKYENQTQIYSNEIKKKLYLNYFSTWSNSKRRIILETIPNLMIGDDHDTTDDDSAIDDKYFKFIKKIALQVFTDIQVNLRIDNQPNDFYYRIYNNQLHLFLGRTYSWDHNADDYVNYLLSIINNNSSKNLYIFFSKPPINFNLSTFIKLVYPTDNNNYQNLYQYLKELKDNNYHITLIGGDLHRYVYLKIYYEKEFLFNFYIIPPINSGSTIINKINYFTTLNLSKSFNYKIIDDYLTNGYLILDNNNITTFQESYLYNNLVNDIYMIYQFKWAKWTYESFS
jgi:hypothetical protein